MKKQPVEAKHLHWIIYILSYTISTVLVFDF